VAPAHRRLADGPRRSDTTLVVVNPAAGRRRARSRVRAALAADGAERTNVATRHPGEARSLARLAASGWADLVVAVGGDGTIHEVVNGLCDARRRAALGVVDCGTGSGFAESLGLPRSREAQVRLLARGRLGAVDLGRLACSNAEGDPVQRVFASECQVGIGAAICARLGRLGRCLGGRLGFRLTAMLTGLGHPMVPMEVTLDEGPPRMLPLLGVVVANGARTGGGMRLAPQARLDDGLLDVILIHAMSRIRRAGFLRRVYRGAHVDGIHCSARTVRRLRIRSSEAVPVAADGEVLGTTPFDVEVLPRALDVVMPGEEV